MPLTAKKGPVKGGAKGKTAAVAGPKGGQKRAAAPKSTITNTNGTRTIEAGGVKVTGTKETKVKVGGEIFSVNDTILIRPPSGPPFIARVHTILKQANTGKFKVLVVWYYRPEEAKGGRKQYHGEREVFDSDHMDWCDATNIDGRCKVMTMRRYQRLKHISDNVYYTRFTYAAETGEFSPDRVSVYCTCEMPYNPDQFMAQCDSCHDWFHAQCLGAREETLQAANYFLCPYCKRGIPYEQRGGDMDILPEDYMLSFPGSTTPADGDGTGGENPATSADQSAEPAESSHIASPSPASASKRRKKNGE